MHESTANLGLLNIIHELKNIASNLECLKIVCTSNTLYFEDIVDYIEDNNYPMSLDVIIQFKSKEIVRKSFEKLKIMKHASTVEIVISEQCS